MIQDAGRDLGRLDPPGNGALVPAKTQQRAFVRIARRYQSPGIGGEEVGDASIGCADGRNRWHGYSIQAGLHLNGEIPALRFPTEGNGPGRCLPQVWIRLSGDRTWSR